MGLSPPTRMARHPNRIAPSLPIGRRGNRAVLAQCRQCIATGTAAVRRGAVRSLNLPATYHRGQWAHAHCGGLFDFFDIEVTE